MTFPKHPGQTLVLGGQEWHFAPMPIDLLVRYLPRLEAAQTASASGSLTALAELLTLVGDMAWEALKRNHPDVTRDQVGGELVDFGNFDVVQQAVLTASGLGPKAPAAAAAASS